MWLRFIFVFFAFKLGYFIGLIFIRSWVAQSSMEVIGRIVIKLLFLVAAIPAISFDNAGHSIFRIINIAYLLRNVTPLKIGYATSIIAPICLSWWSFYIGFFLMVHAQLIQIIWKLVFVLLFVLNLFLLELELFLVGFHKLLPMLLVVQRCGARHRWRRRRVRSTGVILALDVLIEFHHEILVILLPPLLNLLRRVNFPHLYWHLLVNVIQELLSPIDYVSWAFYGPTHSSMDTWQHAAIFIISTICRCRLIEPSLLLILSHQVIEVLF